MLLISKKANVNHLNKNGNTPLFAASYNGNFSICQLLILHGADINLKNNNGWTSLIVFSYNGLF